MNWYLLQMEWMIKVCVFASLYVCVWVAGFYFLIVIRTRPVNGNVKWRDCAWYLTIFLVNSIRICRFKIAETKRTLKSPIPSVSWIFEKGAKNVWIISRCIKFHSNEPNHRTNTIKSNGQCNDRAFTFGCAGDRRSPQPCRRWHFPTNKNRPRSCWHLRMGCTFSNMPTGKLNRNFNNKGTIVSSHSNPKLFLYFAIWQTFQNWQFIEQSTNCVEGNEIIKSIQNTHSFDCVHQITFQIAIR